MPPEITTVLYGGLGMFGAWVVKEVASIRPLKENVQRIADQVDAIHEHLLGVTKLPDDDKV